MIDALPVSDAILTNAYFYIDEQTRHGFLIDPGAEADRILQKIKDNKWVIEKILITHGHFDHIGAVQKIHQELKIPYFAHQKGKDYLTDVNYNLSVFFGKSVILNKAEYLKEGDEVTLQANPDIKLKVIYTPGHTQDSVIYYDINNNTAFVGDTIFKNSVGRTDLPGGNTQQLYQSIEEKIFTLPNETVLYSGHSEPTTVREEKR
ncbi:MAG: MBL fold metallo-hydrolase [Alphaproteobacteria bacterium]|nr:MBL fold metallo-hydrolase [Alphaproteobacteria bacterium]